MGGPKGRELTPLVLYMSTLKGDYDAYDFDLCSDSLFFDFRCNQRFDGLICKTPQAIESAFAIYDANPGATMDEIIATQNSGVPDSCMYASVIKEDGEVVASFKYKDKSVDIKKALIKAICRNDLCLYGDISGMFIAHWSEEGVSI